MDVSGVLNAPADVKRHGDRSTSRISSSSLERVAAACFMFAVGMSLPLYCRHAKSSSSSTRILSGAECGVPQRRLWFSKRLAAKRDATLGLRGDRIAAQKQQSRLPKTNGRSALPSCRHRVPCSAVDLEPAPEKGLR